MDKVSDEVNKKQKAMILKMIRDKVSEATSAVPARLSYIGNLLAGLRVNLIINAANMALSKESIEWGLNIIDNMTEWDVYPSQYVHKSMIWYNT